MGKNKKIIMYLGILLILIILIIVGYSVYNKIKNKNANNIEEYIPQEEITQKQLRQTVINLYFLDKNNYELVSEVRQIDAKELIYNPYKFLINLLIEGPKDSNLIKLIPDNTKINNVEVKDNILYLDFSNDFINMQNLGKEQEELIIKSIVNTVTQLTEVNAVKILIDGEENKSFPDNQVSFDKIFIKQK